VEANEDSFNRYNYEIRPRFKVMDKNPY